MAKHKYAQQRRNQIYQAFAICIQNRDYDQVTMRMVAEKSGLSYCSLYYYFKNKDDILASYYNSFSEIYRARVREIMVEYSKESLAGLSFIQLVRLIVVYMNSASFDEQAQHNNRTTNLTVHLLAARNPDFRTVYIKNQAEFYCLLKEILAYSGIPIRDSDAAARFIGSLIHGLVVYTAIDEDMPVMDVINKALQDP